MAIERHFVSTYGSAKIAHAPIVKAGKWLFGTGLRAVDAMGQLVDEVGRPALPLSPPPKEEREAAFIFNQLQERLSQLDSDLSRIVRLDQYYPHWRAVDPYHCARKAAMQGKVAPSTSVIVSELLTPGAAMDIQFMAATAASGLDVSPISADLSSPKESGYAPCLRAGDFIFIAGQLARDDTGCIAAEAQVPDGQLWKGTRIKLETDYLIRNRLVPALDRSGSNLNLILKAQVYLSQETDLPAFWQVWEAAFEGKAPPTTVVPVKHPGFGTREATLEINVIAAHVDAAERIIDIDSDVGLTCPNMLAARKLDELVFCAGLMATDSQGLCSSAHPSACGPYFDDATGAQMEHILEKASQLLDEAGTDLAHVVRALHFQSDLSRFSQAYDKWRDRIGDVGLPFTSIQVNESVFVPGASLILDLIAYAPTKGN